MKGKIVIRIDTLRILKGILDDELLLDRAKLYRLISASGMSNRVYQKLFEQAYTTYPKFQFHVDSHYLFKKPEQNLISAVIEPLRSRINNYQISIDTHLRNNGFKHVMTSHDYVYYATTAAQLPEYEGMTVYD